MVKRPTVARHENYFIVDKINASPLFVWTGRSVSFQLSRTVCSFACMFVCLKWKIKCRECGEWSVFFIFASFPSFWMKWTSLYVCVCEFFLVSRKLCWYLAHALLPWQRKLTVIWGDVLLCVSVCMKPLLHMYRRWSLSLVSIQVRRRFVLASIMLRLAILSSISVLFHCIERCSAGKRDDNTTAFCREIMQRKS